MDRIYQGHACKKGLPFLIEMAFLFSGLRGKTPEKAPESSQNMSNTDEARRIIADISGHDIDTWVRPTSFTHELEEVSSYPAHIEGI